MIIVSMPRFAEAEQRVGRRGYPRSVIVCRREERELRSSAASQLFPFTDRSDTPSALTDIYWGPRGLVRRCRRKSGAAFSPADIDLPDRMSWQDLVAEIMSEPDHPYSAMLALQDRNLPFEYPADSFDWPPDPAAVWRGQMLVVENEIFVPTLTPTLSVSFDQERSRLIAAASFPPSLSPALRMPTVHLPYETDTQILAQLAAELAVELEFARPPAVAKTMSEAPSNEWITKTLADLHLYTSRKGVRDWPEDLPFEVLRHAHQSALYADTAMPPMQWFGEFLETPSNYFAHLATYIQGLQYLVFARYRVLGDELPPLQSDVLIDSYPD